VGSTVSAIPLSPLVTGITYTGLEYPLQDATLALGSTRGVSNVMAATPATLTIREGVLLVVYAG
jgi:thiamine pyrophosphokinase